MADHIRTIAENYIYRNHISVVNSVCYVVPKQPMKPRDPGICYIAGIYRNERENLVFSIYIGERSVKESIYEKSI